MAAPLELVGRVTGLVRRLEAAGLDHELKAALRRKLVSTG